MNKVILVDIDGTVAHRTNRTPYEYNMVLHDRSDEHVVEVLRCMWLAGYKIIFISAREDWCFNDTYRWLTLHCPPFIKLFMRKSGDNRSDQIIKQEIYETEVKPNYDVFCVFDDRDRVVGMWRELGLKVFQPEYGDF